MSRPAYLSECKGPLWIPRLWEEINNNDHLKYIRLALSDVCSKIYFF